MIDRELFFLIYNLPHPLVLTLFLSILSGFGSLGFIWLGISVWLYLKKKLDKSDFAIFLLAFVVRIFLVNLLQIIFLRARPYEDLSNVFYLGFVPPLGYSFPSDHASVSFLAAAYLGEKIKRFKYLFYFLAVLISFTRVYLGAHYPLDVLTGAIFGIILGVVFLKISERRR